MGSPAPLPRRLRTRRDDGLQRNPRPGRRGLVAPGRPPAGVAGSQCRGDAGRAGVRLPPARPLGLLHLPPRAARRARGAGARPDRRRVAPLDPGRAGVDPTLGVHEAGLGVGAGPALLPHPRGTPRDPGAGRPAGADRVPGRGDPGPAGPRDGRRPRRRVAHYARARRGAAPLARRRHGAGRRAGAPSLATPEDVPATPHPDVPEPRPGPARSRVPRDSVEDRGGLRARVGQGVPARDAEPSELPARAAHRLHLLGVRRGVGVRRRDRAHGPLSRARPARAGDRVTRPGPLRRAARARPDGDRLLAGRDQRRDDDGPAARRWHPAALLQLRRVVLALPAGRYRPGDERLDAPLLLLSGAGTRSRERRWPRVALRWDDFSDRLYQLRLRHGADDLLLHLAGLEEDQVRDAAHTVARRRARLSSTFIFTTFSLPENSRAISSTTGAIARHGAHQGAQKSMSTGAELCSTSCSNESSETANRSAMPPTIAKGPRRRKARQAVRSNGPKRTTCVFPDSTSTRRSAGSCPSTRTVSVCGPRGNASQRLSRRSAFSQNRPSRSTDAPSGTPLSCTSP